MIPISTRALLASAASPFTWFPWLPLRPKPTTRIGFGTVLLQAATGFVFVGGLLCLLLAATLNLRDPLAFLFGGAIGGLARGLWFLMLRAAWNAHVEAIAEAPSAAAVTPEHTVASRALAVGVRVCVFLAAAAIAYAAENVRGSMALRGLDRDFAARGTPYTLEAIVPPPVPDDQNLAMYRRFKPVLDVEYPEVASHSRSSTNRTFQWRDPEGWRYAQSMFRVESDKPGYSPAALAKITNAASGNARPSRATGMGNSAYSGTFAAGDHLNLAEWQAYYRWLPDWPKPDPPGSPGRDVLIGLSASDADLRELREAAQARPLGRFPIAYERGHAALLPHLAHLKRAVTHLRLRAVAHLAENESEAALADTLLALRLSDLIADEPTLITHLVRVAMDRLTLQPVWEGCLDRKWNAPQLEALQSALAGRSYHDELVHAIRGEAVLVRFIYQAMAVNRREGLDFLRTEPDELPIWALVMGMAPRGWIHLNEGIHLSLLKDHAEAIQAATSFATSPNSSGAVMQLAGNARLEHLLASRLAPAFSHGKTYEAEAWSRLAQVGLALERHRLAAGRYPERLEELTPKYLAIIPTDPMDGQPLRYHGRPDGTFSLYSIGTDVRDDGGVRRPAASKRSAQPLADLVWR